MTGVSTVASQRSAGAILANSHRERFRVVSYAELRAKATKVAVSILKQHAGSTGLVVSPVLSGGGLPARLICDALELSGIVEAVVPCQLRRYTAVGKGEEVEFLLELDPRRVRGKTLIAIDDLVDGGQTLAAFQAHARKLGVWDVELAVIYTKPHSTVKPDYFAEDGITEWLVLPGEELDFMSELTMLDLEVAGLKEADLRSYFETLGMRAATIDGWLEIKKASAVGVQ